MEKDMRFWNALIGEPINKPIKTEICLYRYSTAEIIELVEQGIVTRQEVIDSGVIHSMFSRELENYIYPPRKVEAALTLIVDSDQ